MDVMEVHPLVVFVLFWGPLCLAAAAVIYFASRPL